MAFEFTPLPMGLRLIAPFYSGDGRGYLLKGYEKEIFRQNGLEMDLFETFESYSVRGVIRGLHFQTRSPQAKLVRAVAGTVFDAAVDLRRGSATFGQWYTAELSQENRLMFYMPPGFAHGFLVLSETALVSYQCAGRYLKDCDTGIVWNDPDIGIEWPLDRIGEPTLSDRDKRFPTLRQFQAAEGGL